MIIMRVGMLLLMLFGLGAAEVADRIAALRPAVDALAIDGKAGDWSAFHAVQAEDGGGRASGFGIASLAIAPSEEGLAICLRGDRRLTRSGGAFWFKLDVAGEDQPDFILGCYWRGPHTLDVLTDDGRQRVELTGISAELGEACELWIPWSALEQAIPAGLRDVHPLLASGLRSWVRVQAESWSYQRGEHRCRDRGLAVASPVLRAEPAALDPALPEPLPDALVMDLPLAGRWYCNQAAFGQRSHRGTWAYDLVRLDRSHRDHPGILEADGGLADRYAYGVEIRAGVAGQVIGARDGLDDSPLGSIASGAEDNALQILTAGGLRLGFGHLRGGSLVVGPGSGLAADTPVAAIGNSGASDGPHLHLVASDHLGSTRPIAFRRVRVSLNSSPDDPWSRALDTWIPRDGFFVERLE